MIRSNIDEPRPDPSGATDGDFQIVGDGVCIAYHGEEENVIFPNQVKELSNYLFFGNNHIKQVHLPENLHTIGAFTFAFCSQLQEITLPDSVGIIETSAFYFCHNLKSVHFSPNSNLSYLGDDAFLGTPYWNKMESMMNKKEYPELFTLGNHSLLKSIGFTKIKVPDSIKSLYSQSFFENTELTHVILPSSVEYLGASTFQDCINLKNVVLSENLSSIPPYCFKNCTSLRAITIHKGVKSIGKGAFEGCYNLKTVFFPEDQEYEKDGFLDDFDV